MKPARELSHQQAAEVLPWFVNGTLTGQEHAAVDAHVRSCLRCRSELELLSQWHRELGHAFHEHPMPPATAASRAAALIARATPSGGRGTDRQGTDSGIARTTDPGIVGQLSRSMSVLAARLAAMVPWLIGAPRAALIATSILLLAGILTLSVLPRAPDTAEFRTLTTPDSLPAGRYVRVALSPQAASSTMDRLVRELGLGIAAGPSENGVYTLTLDHDGWPQVVETLQNDPAVLIAESFLVTVDQDNEP